MCNVVQKNGCMIYNHDVGIWACVHKWVFETTVNKTAKLAEQNSYKLKFPEDGDLTTNHNPNPKMTTTYLLYFLQNKYVDFSGQGLQSTDYWFDFLLFV